MESMPAKSGDKYYDIASIAFCIYDATPTTVSTARMFRNHAGTGSERALLRSNR